MQSFVIQGGMALSGEVRVSGAKNAALPLMAAALLSPEPCIIDNVPMIQDIHVMGELLEYLGCVVKIDPLRHRVTIQAANIKNLEIPVELATKMRASFLVTGPLLARFHSVKAPHPGGCAIGKRPVNVDIRGLKAMGANVEQGDFAYTLWADHLMGRQIYLDYPSHTGTENLLMAATLAKGRTTIKNASAEPEVMDLAEFLVRMGAHIAGAGTPVIQIDGVEELYGIRHRVLADRIEAGTFAIAGAITSGEVTLTDLVVAHMDPLTYKLREAGVEVTEGDRTYTVRRKGDLEPVEVQTLPYPGFPTDLQATFATLLTQAHGQSIVHERVYDNRLLYADELRKLGANIEVNGQTALVNGPAHLVGAKVRALDLRAGAAAVLAGLCAEGTTEISDVFHVYRGYDNLVEKLKRLGAKIELKQTQDAPITT